MRVIISILLITACAKDKNDHFHFYDLECKVAPAMIQDSNKEMQGRLAICTDDTQICSVLENGSMICNKK